MPDNDPTDEAPAPMAAPATPQPPAPDPEPEWTSGGTPDRVRLLDGGRVVIHADGERWELTPPSMGALRSIVEALASITAAARETNAEAARLLRSLRTGTADDEDGDPAEAFERMEADLYERVNVDCARAFAQAINATKRTGPDADADRLPAWAGNVENLRGVVDHWRGNRLAPGT